MRDDLLFLAGPEALRHIRANGLAPDDVKVVLGAAGGPKWLMLAEMDRYLFGDWLPRRTTPVHLLGSSIGAWRHCMYSTRAPMETGRRFLDLYVNQRYSEKPDRAEITRNITRVLDACLPPEKRAEVPLHPQYRVHIMTARTHGLLGSEHRPLLGAGLLATGLANAVSRRSLGLFMERVLFHHPDGRGPFLSSSDLPMTEVALTAENLGDALCASGSIPLVIDAVHDIPDAPRGVYRDGGLIDYHFDIPFEDAAGVVLFPHFSPAVVPGWFDKFLRGRKPHAANYARVLLVVPSPSFIARLPHGKITDRKDFTYYAGRNDHRITYWHAVLGETERLHDRLAEVLAGDRLAEVVQPLDALVR